MYRANAICWMPIASTSTHEWTDFIADVYENGRNKWHYTIPQETAEYAHFVALCKQTLAFENHVATIYVDYLRDVLMQQDSQLAQSRLQALSL